jgi:hypothetical protein
MGLKLYGIQIKIHSHGDAICVAANRSRVSTLTTRPSRPVNQIVNFTFSLTLSKFQSPFMITRNHCNVSLMAPSCRTSISDDVERVIDEAPKLRSGLSVHIVRKLVAHSGYEG